MRVKMTVKMSLKMRKSSKTGLRNGIKFFRAYASNQIIVSFYLPAIIFIVRYYRNFPFGPGVTIYKAIAESKFPLSRLNVRIPETLAAFNDFYWIDYDYEKGESYFKNIEFWASLPLITDRTKVTKETKHRGFVDSLQWADVMYYNRIDVDYDKDPAVINRSWSQFPVNENVEVFTWDKFKQNYKYGPNADGIIQRFVYSPTQKATLYRLVYHNPLNSSIKTNFGFCLSNK